MAIVFHCACGHLLKARPEFVGKKTKCPHCGEVQEIPGSSDRKMTRAAVGAGADPTSGMPGDDLVLAPISLDDGPTPAIGLGGSTDSMATVATMPPPSTEAPTAVVPSVDHIDHDADRQYKVLTHKDMGIASRFDPVKLEETLNRLARRGWAVKSAITMNLPGHGGNHDELIVILER
jgi:hypothetical protein